MSLKHKFTLQKQGTLKKYPGGSRLLSSLTHSMALGLIELEKGGFREPHWHPNAQELTYCLEGRVLITLFSPQNLRSTFTLSAGEVVFFPQGYLHHLENIFEGKSKLILAYNHPSPEDLDLSSTIRCMTAHTLGKTFGSSEKVFQDLQDSSKNSFISQRKTLANPEFSSIANLHKFSLESITAQIQTKAGNARIASFASFPILENLALFSLRLYPKAIREPHWHPNATELNYVLQGKALLTILSPDGTIDTFELQEGDGSIIPAGYLHYIENIGPEELHMAIYFNHNSPSDIGLSGAFSAYSPEVLCSLFSVDLELIHQIHSFLEDRMIVTGGG